MKSLGTAWHSHFLHDVKAIAEIRQRLNVISTQDGFLARLVFLDPLAVERLCIAAAQRAVFHEVTLFEHYQHLALNTLEHAYQEAVRSISL